MRSTRFAFAVFAFLLLAGACFSLAAQSGRRPTYPPNQTEPNQTSPQPVSPPARQSGAQTNPQAPSAADQNGPRELERSSHGAVSNTPDTDDTIKVDTALVTIPLTAMDSNGRFLPNLKKSDFKLYEDDVAQEIESLGAVEVPFNVVLMLDTSGSTEDKMRDIQEAAITFVDQLRRDDRVMVVSFDERIYVDCEFTSDRARLRRAIYGTSTGGSTKLYDAVDLVITERLNRIQGRKAIVLFTDGKDTSSRLASAQSTLQLVEEGDVLVYPIHYETMEQMRIYGPGLPRGGPRSQPWPSPFPYPGGRGRFPGGRGRRWPFDPFPAYQFPQNGGGRPNGGRTRASNSRGAEYLHQLAEKSGGRIFYAESIPNLSQAFASVAEELRHQYTLSYYPTNPARDGAWRRVKVRATQPGVVVRAKDGYRAGGATDAKANAPAEESRPKLKRNIAER